MRDDLGIFNGKYVEKKVLHMDPEKNLTELLRKVNFETYLCDDLMLPRYSYPDYVKNHKSKPNFPSKRKEQ